MSRIFIDCKKYEEVLKEDSELWDIKILGAFSQNKVQNPVRDNYVVIGLSECEDDYGLLSAELCRKIKRKLYIKAYTSEKRSGDKCIEVLSRICKKLKKAFPDEIGNIKLLSCEYITKPYSYCAEAEVDICDCFGDSNVLADVFKEEI